MIALTLLLTAQPIPRVSTFCPIGYYRVGAYCAPLNRRTTPAIPRIGTACPLNYYRNGDYCKSTN